MSARSQERRHEVPAAHRAIEVAQGDLGHSHDHAGTRREQERFGAKYPRSGAVCGVDFTRPGRQNYGGYEVSTMETYRSPSGQVNWRNTATCKEHLI
jgi:hypothetical protein